MSGSRFESLLAHLEKWEPPIPSAADVLRAQFEIESLRHYLETSGDGVPVLYELAPVRVIACVEAGLKAATAALINHGDPYLSNARKLYQQVKIDFDVLKAMIEDRVSLGEVIAHSTGWHDLGEVNSRLSTILGKDFFATLRVAEDRWAIEIQRAAKQPRIASLDKVLADLSDALSVRNRLCHESHGYERLSKEDAERYLEAGSLLLSATNSVITETLSPNAPLTQTDMNIAASQSALAVLETLDKEVAALMPKLDAEDQSLLIHSQELWRDYAAGHSQLEGNAAKGGTLRPLLSAKSHEKMAKTRLREIRDSLRQEGLGGRAKRRPRD
jgi:uncharacterized protein YecT (DUF1311 family)